MRGEIKVRGNVLAVGGIKEKFLAAKRAGVRDVILPTDCKQQVDEDLAPYQIEGVTLHYAARIEDVLAVALPKTPREKGLDEEVREEGIHAGVEGVSTAGLRGGTRIKNDSGSAGFGAA